MSQVDQTRVVFIPIGLASKAGSGGRPVLSNEVTPRRGLFRSSRLLRFMLTRLITAGANSQGDSKKRLIPTQRALLKI